MGKGLWVRGYGGFGAAELCLFGKGMIDKGGDVYYEGALL
jgi:hypothetical protein